MKKYKDPKMKFAPSLEKKSEKQEAQKAEVKCFPADIEGLGRIPIENLKTPSPLIILDKAAESGCHKTDAYEIFSENKKYVQQRQHAMHSRKVTYNLINL